MIATKPGGLIAIKPDGIPLDVVIVTVDRARQERAEAAVRAASARLPDCPDIAVRWFEDRTDSRVNGFAHPLMPGTVWLWSGLRTEDIAATARHELFHTWAHSHRYAHIDADADDFAADRGIPVVKALLGGKPLRVVPAPPKPTIRITA